LWIDKKENPMSVITPKNTAVLALLGLLLVLTSCAARKTEPLRVEWNGDLVSSSYAIADCLEARLTQNLRRDDPIIVASFVNVNDLENSSTLGRIVAEQIASRFAQKNYHVIEMKLRRKSVFIQEGKGEYLLSRDIKELSSDHQAGAVIVGTYAKGFDRLYLSARIVRPTDNVVIAACDSGLPMSFRKLDVLTR
jgi:TolB-like protein